MNLPTQWFSYGLAKKDSKKLEKIKLNQDEQNLIRDLKSTLNPFLEITELLKGSSICCTYSIMNPVLLKIKNNFCSESSNTVEINFEDEESAFDKDNRRIHIDEPVDCTGLINKIKLTLSAALDHYWKDISDPKLIILSLLDPRIKRLSFLSTSERYAA